MAELLHSVGLDIGTTTTQLVISQLQVQNRASGFAVPDMAITQRTVLYESPVMMTPLLDEAHVDGAAIRSLVRAQYESAGIERVDTGAVIITGETARKENAAAVLRELSGFAGEFVVATAGPHLESVLAAKGAGAVELSAQTGKTLLHMDIGGGTANLALIEDGRIVRTGCLNVGGRLIKCDPDGCILYVSPVLEGLTALRVGQQAAPEEIGALARLLTEALEMAAGLRVRTALLERLSTAEAGAVFCHEGPAVLSFSGGVADCIRTQHAPYAFGDMGPALGSAIGSSRLCEGPYRLGTQTIRATVIGAGCHSTQLSGSTVFVRSTQLPLKDLAVAVLTRQEQERPDLDALIAERLQEAQVLALPGFRAPGYDRVRTLAGHIARGMQGRPVYVCLQEDMAKALGQCLSLLLPPGTPCMCLDRVRLEPESYLDVGTPVGPALPVVVKTLVFRHAAEAPHPAANTSMRGMQ